MLRKEGSLCTDMNLHEVQCTIDKYANRSNEYIRMANNEKRLLFQQLVQRVMYDYRVININKVNSSVVTIDDMCSCLLTLLSKEGDEKMYYGIILQVK